MALREAWSALRYVGLKGFAGAAWARAYTIFLYPSCVEPFHNLIIGARVGLNRFAICFVTFV